MESLIKPLITLLAIVNPIGIVPFFIHFTRSFSEHHRARTAKVAAFSAFVVISLSALLGLQIIGFFGISLASFQVGGGLLLLMSAIQMLGAEPAESKPQDIDEGAHRADAGSSIAVVPLTIPLLTGPATLHFQYYLLVIRLLLPPAILRHPARSWLPAVKADPHQQPLVR